MCEIAQFLDGRRRGVVRIIDGRRSFTAEVVDLMPELLQNGQQPPLGFVRTVIVGDSDRC